MNPVFDEANKRFHAVMLRAYEHSKKIGRIPQKDIPTYDRLVSCPPMVFLGTPDSKWMRPVYVHLEWRKGVRRLYANQKHMGFLDRFQTIDWEQLWDWVVKNIIPIVKLLIFIAPLVI